MEEINGVTFRDYACACANLANGMPAEEVSKVLGIEVPVWEATIQGWNNKMSEMSNEDMAFYGEVFANPKQGKFANVEGGTSGVEETLTQYPEWSDHIKMEQYMSAASDRGIDIDFDKEFGISITKYSQLAMHWGSYYREYVMDKAHGDSEASRIFAQHDELTAKWKAFYEEKYADQKVAIADDIEF